VKIVVSLRQDLIAFADEIASRWSTSRSGLLAELLNAERIRQRTRECLDRHAWDVADDKTGWRRYQRRRFAQEYGDDEW
jgi:metal-responsive CopG/Arc/MetJ family transcriptional regulator